MTIKKPSGRVPGSTRVGGELFDRPKYTRTRKYRDLYEYGSMMKVCRACHVVRDVDEMHDLGEEGWVCDDCESELLR